PWTPWAAADGAADPVVELVLAENERQAKVAARAMWTGFFVEQLLIPETRYMGRVPWRELPPGLRAALEDARPGEPNLLRSGGALVVARLMPDVPPSHLGGDSFAQDTERLWSVLSYGPTDTRLLSQEVDVETQDLAEVCRSKERFVKQEAQRAETAVAALGPEASPQETLDAYAPAISALSFDGRIEEAIDRVEELIARLPEDQRAGSRSYRDVMHQVLGIFELRRGEVENCLHHHHREMCLFPLSENARHRRDEGARLAVGHFARYLERHPDNLEVRWLLNVAAMTLGTYPQGVEARFRIEPEAFESEIDPGRLWDVAPEAGLGGSDNAGGSVADDFDGDGLLDLAVSSRDPCSPLRLFRNRGDGTFEDVSAAAGLSGQLGGLNLTQVDFDGDGRLDLFVMRGGWETAMRNSLLRNRPSGEGGVVFEDVTEASGLGGLARRTHSAAWADYDGDGHLDVFLGHELSFSRLFRNRGDGTFEDATDAAGLRFRSLTKGAVWGDIENDGWPDLYVSNYADRNLLFVNRGDGTFEESGRERGVAKPDYSVPTWFFDFDNDGFQDLFVASYMQSVDEVAREYLGLEPQGETLRLYRNRGDGSFEDVAAASGLRKMVPAMGANFGDLDGDGYLDFYLGTGAPPYGLLVPNRLFLNRPRGPGSTPEAGAERRFIDATTATGTGHLQKGHGVSFADLDNDGDQDLFINLGGAFPGDKYPNALFENPGHGSEWVNLRLVGTRSNRSALGARIRVVQEREGRLDSRVRWVGSGGSFGSSPLAQHIGLGPRDPEARVLRIEIEWPASRPRAGEERATARLQVLENPPTGALLVVTEGEPGFERFDLPTFRLGGGRKASGHDGHGGHGARGGHGAGQE
ncbi:MAG: VCBS repeat-containing protein, partial [Acidobacteriota bacterium]